MWLIANDGNPLAKPIRTETQFIGPGERREILVRAGTTPGRVNLQSMNFVPVTKQPSYSAPTRTIATAVIKGKAMEPRPIPETLVPVEDLRDVPIARKRDIGSVPRASTPARPRCRPSSSTARSSTPTASTRR